MNEKAVLAMLDSRFITKLHLGFLRIRAGETITHTYSTCNTYISNISTLFDMCAHYAGYFQVFSMWQRVHVEHSHHILNSIDEMNSLGRYPFGLYAKPSKRDNREEGIG